MTEKEIDDVYYDRNLLACALVQATDAPSGWKPDSESPDEWAIVWVETPVGQVSWHVPAEMAWDLAAPQQDVAFDVYDRNEKNLRLIEWCLKGCPSKRHDYSGREPDDLIAEEAESILREALGDDYEGS